MSLCVASNLGDGRGGPIISLFPERNNFRPTFVRSNSRTSTLDRHQEGVVFLGGGAGGGGADGEEFLYIGFLFLAVRSLRFRV